MLCKTCERILDLDTYFDLEPEGVNDGSHQLVHHSSFNDLSLAADNGCELCQLARDEFQKGARWIPTGFYAGPIMFSFTKSDRSGGTSSPEIPDALVFETSTALVIGDLKPSAVLRLSTDPGSPMSRLIDSHRLSRDSSSDLCYSVASKWLKDCLETHKACPKRLAPLPARVIDVGDETTAPFLYLSNGNHAPWVTLSHCWGTFQPLQTSTSNINLHCAGIDFSSLPKTFQDAVEITRRLGYRYLWIDSLCIIQDSTEDWEAESSKMASIYQDAVLNISAEASQSDDQGIFNSAGSQREKEAILPCYSSSHGFQCYLYAYQASRDGPARSRLQERAWVLQESSLSVRKLCYLQEGLFWRCVDHSFHETRPNDRREFFPVRSVHSVSGLGGRGMASTRDKGQEMEITPAMHWWYRQVNDYIERKLTYEKDKLPAIEGLATAVSVGTRYRYKGGLWTEDFHRGILWKGICGPNRNIFPSWSWASMETGGAYEEAYDFLDTRIRHSLYSAELIDKVPDESRYSSSDPGPLHLRGWLQNIMKFLKNQTLKRITNEIQLSPKPFLTLSSIDPEPGGYNAVDFWPDFGLESEMALEQVQRRKDVVFRISDFSAWVDGSSTYSYFLVLEPTGVDGEYRRVGVIRKSEPKKTYDPLKAIDGWDLADIAIV